MANARVLEFVQAICNGEVVEPFWVRAEATEPEAMNGRYREVLAYFGRQDVQMRARLGVEPCREEGCTGIVRAVESRVPGAFRVDACCVTCGGSEVHRAGWLDRDVRDDYRAAIGSAEVG